MAEGSEEETLVDLLNRATNPSNRDDDVAAVDTFVEKIKVEKDGPQLSVRLLAHKIQSPQEREALQGLNVLDVCVLKCDSRFHVEIGKFRFLNEMIKIVSPKYLGNLTTENVKLKTVRLMFTWTKTLTSEPKIAEAYNMLKRQGIILEDPVLDEAVEEPPPRPPPREDTLFKDEEKQKLLQRLLRSKNPEDHQAANRLIKNIVKEEEERREKGLKRMSELEKVNNNVKLLHEMIEAFNPGGDSSNGDRELMKELFEECERLRPNLFKLASDTDDKDESIAEILKANDSLVKVLEAYQTQVVATGDVVKLLDVTESGSGAAGAPPVAPNPKASSADLLSDDLHSLGLDSSSTEIALTTAAKEILPPVLPAASKDLEDIFKTDVGGTSSSSTNGNVASSAADLSNLMLQPSVSSSLSQSATTSGHSTLIATMTTASSSTIPPPPDVPKSIDSSLDWSNFDKVFSSEAPKEASAGEAPADSADIFAAFKEPPSTEPLPNSTAPASDTPTGIFDTAIVESSVDTLDAPLLQPKNTSTLPLIKDADTPSSQESPSISRKGMEDINAISQGLLENTMKEFGVARQPATNTNVASPSGKMTLAELQKLKETELSRPSSSGTPSNPSPTMEEKPTPCLDDVIIKVESVQPSSTLTPLSLYDQHGLKILLFFAQVSCYPSPDVAVMILTTMSTNTLPLKAYDFQASASKLTPVKLAAPTAKELPPFNPILPPSAISQILLVANPNKEPVKLNFKLSFTLGETAYSDSGESQEFPQTVFS